MEQLFINYLKCMWFSADFWIGPATFTWQLTKKSEYTKCVILIIKYLDEKQTNLIHKKLLLNYAKCNIHLYDSCDLYSVSYNHSPAAVSPALTLFRALRPAPASDRKKRVPANRPTPTWTSRWSAMLLPQSVQ